MAIVAELSLDDIANGIYPATSHMLRIQHAVVQTAATMDAPPYNTPPAKLQQAMDLVLKNKVQAHENGRYTVQGSTKPYEGERHLSVSPGVQREVQMVQTPRRRGDLEADPDAPASHERAAAEERSCADSGTRGRGPRRRALGTDLGR